MSQVLIKKSTKNDIDDILKLIEISFKSDKLKPHIMWLLNNTNDLSDLQSLIAISKNKIIGHIAYIKSSYSVNNKTLTGIHPFLWCVHPEHRGKIGLKLYKETLTYAQFSVIIGGSLIAQKIYPVLEYKYLFDAMDFKKQLQPITASLRIGHREYIKSLIAFSTKTKNSLFVKCEQNDKVILRSQQSKYFEKLNNLSDSVENLVGENKLNWLLQCCDMQSIAFDVYNDNMQIGVLLLYITGNKPYRGRIVHIPCMGGDVSCWYKIIQLAENELKNKGCTEISILSTHPLLSEVLINNGYYINANRKLWLRDNDNYISSTRWHLTYLEGDLGYRGV